MATTRLEVLTNSLAKKEKAFDDKLAQHMADVRQTNGQPLNDKRNGNATLQRWEKQNNSLASLDESIKKTKEAIEREQAKINRVEDANEDMPELILSLVKSGALIQWRKHPNTFFVPGVNKARIVYLPKTKSIGHKFVSEIPDKAQYAIFRDAYNSLRTALAEAV